MAHETPRIKAEPRQRTGSRYAQRLRREGKLPAVVYGHKQDPVHLIVNGKEITTHLQAGAHLLEVEQDGGAVETCLIKDVQYDYLGSTLIHVDLARVDLNEEIEVSVPVTVKGRDASPGAKAAGALVELLMADIEVLCTAGNIPDEVIADISSLDVDEHLTVGELKYPEGVRAARDADDIVVAIHVAKEEIAPAAPAEGAEAQPEVLTERKPTEGAETETPKKK